MTDPATDGPIVVNASKTKAISETSFRALLTAGGAVVADRTLHSETAIIAVMAGMTVLGGWAWGIVSNLHKVDLAAQLADMLPNHKAVVK